VGYTPPMSPTLTEAQEPTFTVEIERKTDVTIVHCRGRLVAGVASLLQSEVKPLILPKQHVVLELTALTRMDSLGLGTIVGLAVSAKRAGCQLELVNLGKQIRQLFAITNLLTMFEGAGDNTFRLP
jgi:anti-sigma B factor antagonist